MAIVANEVPGKNTWILRDHSDLRENSVLLTVEGPQ
jgi:hypothetical protein